MNAGRAASRQDTQPTDSLDDFSVLAACVLPHLDGTRIRSGVGTVVFEVAAPDAPGAPGVRYVVKLHRGDHTRATYEALSRLWEAGFRPPSPYTVVRPVAYIADPGLLVQEKAPGALLLDLILGKEDGPADALVRAAGWLAALHGSTVAAPARQGDVIAAVARYGKELSDILPTHASRIRHIAARALGELESPARSPSVPSHGDFHPKNVFITEGRVTVIDFDTFGGQEAAADIGYFLAQTAIMGCFRRGDFAVTSRARSCFLTAYERAGRPLPRRRLALYLGMAFLQSLHYELWVLRNDKPAIIEPWLNHCERCLLNGEATLG